MLKKWIKRSWAAVMLAITPAIAYAGPAEDATQNWFYANSQADRTAHLNTLEKLDASDNTAKFGLGSLQFFSAIEGLSQDLVRYGAMNQRGGMRDLVPFPLPQNPNPDTLTYEELRDVFTRFETKLETARATLSQVDANTPTSIEINFVDARFDLAGMDAIPDEMRFAAITQSMMRGRPTRSSSETQPNEAELRQALTFKFDNADAIWLEGYSNVLLSQVDFLLAHDFEKAFNASFQMFFPNSNLPMQQDLIPNGYISKGGMFGDEGMIADTISLIHLMDWPVVEPARRADFTRHMQEVARLSHANWKAIRVETDNDGEWLPGPQQPGIHPLTGIAVTEEMVTGWNRSMDLLDDIMSGKRLIPHWRFEDRGFNVKKFFDSTDNFNPLLLATGPAAIPFMEEGDIVTTREWREIQRTVGRRNFGMVAAWFN